MFDTDSWEGCWVEGHKARDELMEPLQICPPFAKWATALGCNLWGENISASFQSLLATVTETLTYGLNTSTASQSLSQSWSCQEVYHLTQPTNTKVALKYLIAVNVVSSVPAFFFFFYQFLCLILTPLPSWRADMFGPEMTSWGALLAFYTLLHHERKNSIQLS